MKTNKFAMLIPLAACGLLSCSHDDTNGIAPSQKEVRFNVTVPRAPRGVTETSTIDNFRIFSFVNKKPYMHNVSATKNDGSGWVTTPVMYWPADASPVNFYCISPMIGEVADSDVPNPNIENYDNATGKTDLLYSVNIGATVNPVSINFRHALSKVAFNFKRMEASPSQAPIKVDVSEVTLTAINTKGSFTYPDKTTSSESSDAGTWHDQGSKNDIAIFNGPVTTLTDQYATLNSSGYEFALPQELATSTADLGGAYVKVKCAVYDETSGVRIWPKSAESDYLYFPLNSTGAANTTAEWQAGKAYAYNITVGVPQDSGKIEFDVTVDQYPTFEDMYLEQ